MRWPHLRTRLVGVHNPARCLAMIRICHPRLRRGCGSESRSGPDGDVEAARVDYVVTGVEARRVRVAVLSRTTTRGHPLARRCSIGPRFLLRKTPRGNGATRAARRETARPSRRLSCGRKANSRGMLFKIISNRDDQLVAVKITLSLRSYFFRPKMRWLHFRPRWSHLIPFTQLLAGRGQITGLQRAADHDVHKDSISRTHTESKTD